ncbi:MAG: alkaline phosphatase D family protein [Burkholderiaceae bacterium]|nr:alkaline phosphatase D family protein [Burkholderiaceae bacterium]
MVPQPTQLHAALPPLHRVERVRDAEGKLTLLTALQAQMGWPREWAFVPVRWTGRRFVRLDEARAYVEQAHCQPFGDPVGEIGDPVRVSIPEQWFALPMPDQDGMTGLMCLLVYDELRAQTQQGARGARTLEEALAAALAADPVDLRHAFVVLPSADPAAATDEGLSLVLASNAYPPGILDNSPGAETEPDRAGPADAALARLVDYTRNDPEGQKVSLLLINGNEIMADPTGGLSSPASRVDRYSTPYQQFKAGLIRHLPPTVERVLHLIDDGEIVGGWEPVLNPRHPEHAEKGPYFDAAVRAAWAQRWEPAGRPAVDEHFWHCFQWRGAAFFIADTRTEREPRTVRTLETAHIMGQAQRLAIETWLDETRGMPRFLVGAAVLLPRKLAVTEHAAYALQSDGWDGYPASFNWLLGTLWDKRAGDVVMLSGGAHQSALLQLSMKRQDAPDDVLDDALQLKVVNSASLYAPWPFAQPGSAWFVESDAFELSTPAGQVVQCAVTLQAQHAGDGFTAVRLRGGDLRLDFVPAQRCL